MLAGFDVIAVDLPGHGALTGQSFTTSGAVKVITDALPTGRPAVIVGHSLGGYFAAMVAARYPDRVRGLAMLGASGDPASRAAWVYRAYAHLTRRIDHRRLARFRDRVARLVGVPNGVLPPAASYAALPEIWQAVFDDVSLDLLRDVTCPVLFLNGRFDQMRVHERRCLALAPNSSLRIVPGATHLAPLTHQEQVAHELQRFVDEIRSH